MENIKNEIERTRVGGFGGSDAAMFYRVGLKGIEALTDTDKRRIAVALGQVEFEPIPTNAAMEGGNAFEAYLATHHFPEMENNGLLEADFQPRNFRIFAHADFVLWVDDSHFTVVEAKYTGASLVDTKQTYMPQLQWYYLLGADEVELAKGTQGLPFKKFSCSPVYRNQNIIDTLHRGIDTIDTFCDTFVYQVPEAWGVENLLPTERKDLSQLTAMVKEVKRLEDEMANFKTKMLAIMLKNEVKKIEFDGITLIAVGESTRNTFDKKKMLQDHPEIDEQKYTKTSISKPYIKILLK